MEVHVSVETRELLAKQYDECLCKECLFKIEEKKRAMNKE